MDGVARLAVATWVALANTIDNVHTAADTAKDAMLAIEVGSGAKGNEELGAIGVWASVGHGEDARAVVLEGERTSLIIEFVAGATSAGASGIATLGHEASDDTMECSAVIEALTREEDEIVDSDGSLPGEKLDLEVASVGVEDGDVALVGVDLHRGGLAVLVGHVCCLLNSGLVCAPPCVRTRP